MATAIFNKIEREYDTIKTALIGEAEKLTRLMIDQNRFRYIFNLAFLHGNNFSYNNLPIPVLSDNERDSLKAFHYISRRLSYTPNLGDWQRELGLKGIDSNGFRSVVKVIGPGDLPPFPISQAQLESMGAQTENGKLKGWRGNHYDSMNSFFGEFQRTHASLKKPFEGYPVPFSDFETINTFSGLDFPNRYNFSVGDQFNPGIWIDNVTGRKFKIPPDKNKVPDLVKSWNDVSIWRQSKPKWFIIRGFEGIYIDPPFSSELNNIGEQPSDKYRLAWGPLITALSTDTKTLPFRDKSVDGGYYGRFYWQKYKTSGFVDDMKEIFSAVVGFGTPLIKFVPGLQLPAIILIAVDTTKFARNVIKGNISLSLLVEGLDLAVNIPGLDTSKLNDIRNLANRADTLYQKSQDVLNADNVLGVIDNMKDLGELAGIDIPEIKLGDTLINNLGLGGVVEGAENLRQEIENNITVAKNIVNESEEKMGILGDIGTFIKEGKAEELVGSIIDTVQAGTGLLTDLGVLNEDDAKRQAETIENDVERFNDAFRARFMDNAFSTLKSAALPIGLGLGALFLVFALRKFAPSRS